MLEIPSSFVSETFMGFVLHMNFWLSIFPGGVAASLGYWRCKGNMFTQKRKRNSWNSRFRWVCLVDESMMFPLWGGGLMFRFQPFMFLVSSGWGQVPVTLAIHQKSSSSTPGHFQPCRVWWISNPHSAISDHVNVIPKSWGKKGWPLAEWGHQDLWFRVLFFISGESWRTSILFQIWLSSFVACTLLYFSVFTASLDSSWELSVLTVGLWDCHTTSI